MGCDKRISYFLAVGLVGCGLCWPPGTVAHAASALAAAPIIVTAAGGSTVARVRANAKGQFKVSGLKPGNYRVCLANGTGCAEATVGEAGIIRGVAVGEEGQTPGKKHQYVGHVTLLR